MTEHDSVELRRASARLAAQFVILIVVLFAVVGAVLFAIVSESQSQATQRTLNDASKIDSPHDAPTGSFVTIVDEQGAQSSPNLPKGLPDQDALDRVAASGDVLQQTKTIDGRTYIICTSPERGHVTQVAVDLQESQAELQRLAWALVISGLIAAVAAGLIAVWISRRAMRPMSQALALQRRFVMDASHELRTPLTLLSTRAQLVRRRLAKAPDGAAVAAAGLDEIVDDSRMLEEILEDLLISADPREMADRSPIDLNAIADDAVHAMLPAALRRGLSLTRSSPAPHVMVTVARVSILRLFTALITNALDHARTSVHVDVHRQGRDAVIRVSDDGPGFPAGMDERAFERFASSRRSSSESDQPRHYGLGLALVAEVATRHGGAVSVSSAEDGAGAGAGAIVTVRLPANT